MNVSVITIGDEILYGQTVDTNSAWIGEQCSLLGLNVIKVVSIGDDEAEIKHTLQELLKVCEIVFITGGLGPTNDDLTKKTLASFFESGWKTDEQVLKDIEERFKNRRASMLQSNIDQANIPDNAKAVRNLYGTAPGMWFELNGKVVISMPGVPHEMKQMMQNSIFPQIKKKYKLPLILHRYILTAGVGESIIAEKLIDFEKTLPAHIRLAYLPGIAKVKLRLTARGNDFDSMDKELQQLTKNLDKLLHKHIYGYNEDTLEGSVLKLFKEKKLKLAVAESCTGGQVAGTLVSVAGSSAYFEGGIIAYNNEVKKNLLDVKSDTLEKYGAVSEETVIEMVKGVCKKFNADIGLAVSGIAGPKGGTPEKPVGTVWIAFGKTDNIQTKKLSLPGNRKLNILGTTLISLNELRKYVSTQIG
ncbi:MAG: competence/damage-inducible protein A [Chitinophagaceae bacterium]|nr:MAG: competence/damage-inducible protein A [Chitinophagaceae bacterium]